MSDKPVIEFKLNKGSLDFSDEAQLQDELQKSGGKWFDGPGNVDLEIVAADFHKSKDAESIFMAKDETWFMVKVKCQGAGDKTIDHYLMVPTSKIKYGEKATLAPYKKLQEFFFAIGEELSLNSLQKLVSKYFADPGKGLVGVKFNADLGYEGTHIALIDGTDEFGVIVKGNPMKEDGEALRFPDKQSALTWAKAKSIQTSMVKIIKLTPKAKTKKLAAVVKDAPVADPDVDETPASKKSAAKAKVGKAAAAADEW